LHDRGVDRATSENSKPKYQHETVWLEKINEIEKKNIRETKHERSAVPVSDECTEIAASLVDLLEVLRVDHHRQRHTEGITESV